MEQRYSCGALVKQIHDALEKDANNMMRPKGLTMAQFSVLMILREAEGLQAPLKELERALHVAQSTAAGIVSRLEQKRYVTCYTSQEDRRIKMVRLTPDGLECCRPGGPGHGRGGEQNFLRHDTGRAGHLLCSAEKSAGFPAVKRPDEGRAFPPANQ